MSTGTAPRYRRPAVRWLRPCRRRRLSRVTPYAPRPGPGSGVVVWSLEAGLSRLPHPDHDAHTRTGPLRGSSCPQLLGRCGNGTKGVEEEPDGADAPARSGAVRRGPVGSGSSARSDEGPARPDGRSGAAPAPASRPVRRYHGPCRPPPGGHACDPRRPSGRRDVARDGAVPPWPRLGTIAGAPDGRSRRAAAPGERGRPSAAGAAIASCDGRTAAGDNAAPHPRRPRVGHGPRRTRCGAGSARDRRPRPPGPPAVDDRRHRSGARASRHGAAAHRIAGLDRPDRTGKPGRGSTAAAVAGAWLRRPPDPGAGRGRRSRASSTSAGPSDGSVWSTPVAFRTGGAGGLQTRVVPRRWNGWAGHCARSTRRPCCPGRPHCGSGSTAACGRVRHERPGTWTWSHSAWRWLRRRPQKNSGMVGRDTKAAASRSRSSGLASARRPASRSARTLQPE